MTDDIDDDDKTEQAARSLVMDLILAKSLYSTLLVEDGDDVGEMAERILRDANVGTFDYYCTTCKRETPFTIRATLVNSVGGMTRNGNRMPRPAVFGINSVCERDGKTYSYVFRKINKAIVKIGQWPSLADISFAELRQIDKSLDGVDRRELGQAIGLFAHGAAAGAFVYLRRVFERMIVRAHERQSHNGNPIKGFDQMRMSDRIAALKDELPAKVVRQSGIFSVLSGGIHELSDEQCLAIFPLMKALIFQMLEDEEHRRKKAIAERETEAALQILLSAGRPSVVKEES